MRYAASRPRAIAGFASLPMALLLAGCFGNEPDADDILTAVRRSRPVVQFLMLSYPGVNFNNSASVESAASRAFQGAKVEKLGCSEKPGLPGLLCEFRIGLNPGNGSLRYEKTMQRFLKRNGTWEIVT